MSRTTVVAHTAVGTAFGQSRWAPGGPSSEKVFGGPGQPYSSQGPVITRGRIVFINGHIKQACR
jgi:hypothetical protein